MDESQMLDQAMALLKPVAVAGQAIGTKVAANALWDWLKARFQTRSAAAAEAVAEIEKSPEKNYSWDALRVQLNKAIAEDEVFRRELQEQLKAAQPQINQTLNVVGDNNKSAQVNGSGNNVSIQ